MNKQEIFNRVYRGLLAQKYASGDVDTNNVFSCRYHDSAGRKCAIGQFIPDCEYDNVFEGFAFTWKPLCDIIVEQLEVAYIQDKLELLRELQIAHDRWFPRAGTTEYQRHVDSWKVQMQEIAYQYGLTVPTDENTEEAP